MGARARIAANDDGRPAGSPVVALRRVLRREEAALYIGVSASKFDAMVAAKEMPKPKRIGGCVVWDIRAPGPTIESHHMRNSYVSNT